MAMQARSRKHQNEGTAAAEFQRGLGLHRAGRLDLAVGAYDAAVRLAPGHGDAYHNLGAALAGLGREAEAIDAWTMAVHLRPDEADSAVALGQALLNAGRHGAAAAMLSAASQRHPEDARLLALNGRALLAIGEASPGIGALLLSLELAPSAATHAALGSALFDRGDLAQAMHHSLAAFRLAPGAAHGCTLSFVLIALGHFAEALAVADHALELDADRLEGLVNRAIALEGLGRWDDAVVAGRRTVAAAPRSAIAHLNLAVTQLSMGEMTADVWDTYEWRLRLHGDPAWLGLVPQWQGEAAPGRTILLHAEQGLGDTLQFVRYAPLVAARSGARVVLAVQAPLARLLRAVPGVDHVAAVGGALSPFDLVCPLLSLPRLFGTTLASIPPVVPYADRFAPWHDGATGLRVGLVWAGSQGTGYDRQRSLSAQDLAGLAGIPGVQFYSLQRPEPGRDPVPPALAAVDLMGGVQDFADTAALIAGLDLVVAVDTAVAHLAATMGKPVWLLSRFRGCWRWLLDRDDSPWYPGLRVLRQQRPNDWSATIAEVREDLAMLATLPRLRPAAAPRLSGIMGSRGL